jgi:prepilin-type N-terminal cleavage/methylation domain-containing protein
MLSIRVQSSPLHVLARAFSLLEIMVVVVIIGILAAIVIPNFSAVQTDSKASAVQSTLAGVRSSIAGYRSTALLRGQSPFPTLAQLTSVGTVMQQEIPANPFSNLKAVQQVSVAQAQARTVINPTTYGWNYCVDNSANPPVVYFYCNSTNATAVSNGSGGTLNANQL